MHLIETLTKNHNAKVRLFCFHYGGGSSTSFYPWISKIPSFIELMAVELAGRGRNMSQPLLTNVHDITALMIEEIKYYLDKPFIFFGHSVGSLICFDLTKAMREQNLQIPMHLILSGSMAPHTLHKRKHICHLDDIAFTEELKVYNGIPQEVQNEPSLMEMFLPIIRADMSIIENYNHSQDKPLDCNITTIAGKNDPTVAIEDVQAWKSHTMLSHNHYTLDGDHFFIKTELQEVINIVLQTINMHFEEDYSEPRTKLRH
jgi:surfactin synthase thioesterase subunit